MTHRQEIHKAGQLAAFRPHFFVQITPHDLHSPAVLASDVGGSGRSFTQLNWKTQKGQEPGSSQGIPGCG